MNLLAMPVLAAVLGVLVQDAEPGQEVSVAQEPEFSRVQIEETIEEVGLALELCREARGNGDLEEARLHLHGALEILKCLDGSEDSSLFASLRWIDGEAKALGLLQSQRAVREWMLAIREATLPSDHLGVLRAKLRLATTRKQLGDLAGALALGEDVHAAWERLLPADHPDLLRAKQGLGATREQLGDFEGAHALFEVVHVARERQLPADHPDLLAAKLNLGVAREQLGDLTGAQALFEVVHAAWERLLSADHPNLLLAKQNLARTRKKLGDLAGAHELFEYVHAARERLLPADHPSLLTAKQNLASTRALLGDLEGAHALNEYVHVARERLLPPDHPSLLVAKEYLATTREQLGDLEGALALFEYVHAARERLLPPGHPDLLDAKLNLANLRAELGDLEGAQALFEYVHAAQERVLPADHSDLLAAKHNLAATRRELGDLEGALALQEYVHSARERRLPPDHPDLLAAKQNLAATRKGLGDLAGAQELNEVVHSARERLLPPDHPDILSAKQNLAATRSQLGDLEGALALFEYVHAARERLLPPDHPDVLEAQQNLAGTRRRLGDLEGAHALTRSLLAAQLVRASSLRTRSSRAARCSALGELHRLPDALLWSELGVSDPPDRLEIELFSVLETLRLVSTSSSEVALEVLRFPELTRVRGRVADARSALNDLVLSPPEDAGAVEGWRKELVELADDRDALERELRVMLAEKGVLTSAITSAVVAQKLEEGSAAVTFFRYPRRFEDDPETGQARARVDSLLAFVVTPDARVRRVELGPSDELEELVGDWRRALSRADARGVGVAPNKLSEVAIGRALREKLLDPCLATLRKELPARLHVVLDDFLHLVPMDALPWKGGLRLGDVLELRQEVSMLRLVSPATPVPDGGTLLALGWVDFDADGVAAPLPRITIATPPVRGLVDRTSAPGSFIPLRQTRYEVQDVGSQYEEHFDAEPVVLMEANASKAALVEAAPKARYLHLATHGWFAPETFTSMRDTLERSGGDLVSLARAEDSVRGFAPDTLCGLALAGANHGANSLGKVPGIITAEELATLDLSQCELAVLSACETNVGIRRAGQGIQSLQSALHSAGARTAITSLWKVDDAATRRFMEIFYTKLWDEKLGKADALWQTKKAMQAEEHPLKDWTGWVLTGAPN